MIILVGEIIVSLVTAGVYLTVEAVSGNDAFTYKVITGLLLGTGVVLANYIFLSVSVNRAVNKVMAERPDREMTDEEIEEFAATHQNTIKNAATLSYVVRTVSMLVTFILVFTVLKEWFAVLATIIPLLAFRPILTVGEFIRRRRYK